MKEVGIRRTGRSQLRYGVAAIALLAIAGANSANAQQATTTTTTTEEIVVTGSRIARPNLTQPNPVQVVTSETIQALGITSTMDVVNQLPQTQNNMTMASSNRFINGAGVSFANLRGLGEYRTLTLVDGKRHVGSLSGRNGSGGTSLVDLNSIPPGLIERVEVVTGGSSAVYGADAVAGVVNVILKKNYEGAEISTEYKVSDDKGYKAWNVNGIVGANLAGGRGNVTLGFDYNHDQGLYGKDRDFAMYNLSLTANPRSLSATDGIFDRITVAPTVSSTVAANGAAVIKTALQGAGSQYRLAVNPGGTGLVVFNRGTFLNAPTGTTGIGDANTIGGDGVNTSQYNTLRVPNTRMVVDTLLKYQLAENVGPLKTINFFADVKYSNSRGTTRSTPATNGSGTRSIGVGTSGTGSLGIRADNAFVPLDLRALLATNGITGAGTFDITRLNEDWDGTRGYRYEYSVFRAVAGFNGEFSNGWKYEAYGNYGRNHNLLVNKDRVTGNFLQQIDSTIVNGVAVCRDEAARANGCVPINPFRVGPLTQAQHDYSYASTKEIAVLTQQSAGANVSGDLISYRTPFSGTVAPLGFAAGVEYRREFTTDSTDYLAQQPSGFIYGNQNTGPTGSYIAREAFLELAVPLLRDLPFAKATDLGLAYRYSKYSTAGSTNTWNINLAHAINDDVKLRAAVARAVRAPNLDDLLTPAGDNFLAVSDVCSVENIGANPTRLANCRANGVPVGYDARLFTNPSVRTGGNPNIKPEIGSTFTAGVVLTPSFIPGLNVTIDYWWVRITGGQAALTPGSLISNCYDAGVTAQCAAIRRRPDGSIATIDGAVANLGKERTRGVDLGASYSFDLDRVGLKNAGGMIVGFDGTWNPENFIIQDPGNANQKLYRAGTAGYPHLRGTFRGVWDLDNLSVTYQLRFIGKSEMYPATSAEIADQKNIPTAWYSDLSAKYRWRNMTVFGGVNNLFDKKPPQIAFLYQGSYLSGSYATFPVTTGGGGAYDAIGRAFYLGASVKF